MKIDITIPRSWSELTQEQLRMVFAYIAIGLQFDSIKVYCFFKWTDLQVLGQIGKDYLLKKDGKEFLASPLLIQSACDELSYLEEIPCIPVALEKIHRKKGLDKSFSEVPFKKFIICDNLYQGYMHTKDASLLDSMAAILYQHDNIITNETDRTAVFYWWASLKNFFHAEFSHFFQSVGGNQPDNIGKAVKSAMNAQIRALTKGDITKEKEVLAMDTWRALTELDALAKEYEDLERKYPTKK